MTEFSPLPNSPTEHISPEGVEERIINILQGFITLTQGGKYRVYFQDGIDSPTTPVPESFSNEERAAECLIFILSLKCSFRRDEKGTMDEIMKALKEGKDSP